MPNNNDETIDYSRKHTRFGWWALLVFLTLGFGLEMLHGFKIRAYLDVSNETRRFMWTLAHAHGSLLSLVHVLFGVCLRVMPELGTRNLRLSSWSLVGASFLLPGGFFLGGMFFYSGDPGLGIVLVPIGGTLLGIAIYLIARSTEHLRQTLPSAKQKSKNKRN